MIDIRRRLKRAIIANDLLVVKRLCTENPSTCTNWCDKDEKGNTPLHTAAELGLYSIVVFLCAIGHEGGGITKNFDGQTALMVASGSTHPAADDVVFYLVGEFGKCVNWRDKFGLTALMMAAKSGNDANVNILLDYDADINAKCPLGNTPLHYASAYGHLKVIRTLIDRGADTSHRNREGWDAKDYSFSKTAEIYYKSLVDHASTAPTANPSSDPLNPPLPPFQQHGMGGTMISGGTPGSRDGKRPGTAGSFSYSMSGSGSGVPGSSGSDDFGSGYGRTVKRVASVEFTRTERGSSFSGRSRGGSIPPAVGSISSYASGSTFGSIGSGPGSQYGHFQQQQQQYQHGQQAQQGPMGEPGPLSPDMFN